MNSDPLLTKAAILAKNRNYEGAFKILKDEEDRYNGSFKYYYLYGIISLHAGNFVEAHEYLQYANRIKFNDVSTLLGLAVLYLKRLNTVKTIDLYLDVLEKDPKNKIAKNAMNIMQKYSAPEALSDWMTPLKLEKLYPPIPAPLITKKTVFTIVFSLIAAFFLTFGILVLSKTIPNPFKNKTQRLSEEYVLSRQERNEPVETGGYYRYILTSGQAITLYERALSLFTEYRDEAAKVSLNRILESNASEGLKNKARLLFANTEIPGFDTFKRSDNPGYSDVKSEPVVYKDVYIIWKGMATNVEVTDDGTSFDLLVGYDTRRTLEGIVSVIFNKPVAVNTERPLEVLGKITPASSYTDISLEGVAIHQSGKLEN